MNIESEYKSEHIAGGVHVIGFVYNSTPDVFTKSESKIRKLLSGYVGHIFLFAAADFMF